MIVPGQAILNRMIRDTTSKILTFELMDKPEAVIPVTWRSVQAEGKVSM